MVVFKLISKNLYHKIIFFVLCICISSDILSFAKNKREFITNQKLLTKYGKRSGEGYFHPNGKKMIFQSERSKNPFYQIYTMDLSTKNTRLISTGVGKSTCAWFHPEKEYALYSSTHHDLKSLQKQKEEIKKRKSKYKRRYSWDYDYNFDIYKVSLKDPKNLKNITNVKGYDAEASYSPNGKFIVFSSNRHAFKGSNSVRKDVKKNPSLYLDIYTMDSEGKNIYRLTTDKGYDGGPFFSPDGKKIVWRHFEVDKPIAEIYIMDANGKNKKKLTNLKKISWAPFFHPSGDYIIFTTNVHGYKNFELYIVDTKGKSKPIRVTNNKVFDGLPVFHPNGKQIVWSKKLDNGTTQIILGDWNDNLARSTLGLAPSKYTSLLPRISLEDLKQWVYYLASEDLRGRDTGSKEEEIYASKIASCMNEMSLVPYGVSENFFHTFDFVKSKNIDKNSTLEFNFNNKKFSAVLNDHWKPLSGRIKSGKNFSLVFAGFGLEIPPFNYDSYAHINVENKWVLVIDTIPENLTSNQKSVYHRYSHLNYKASVAKRKGALGLIVTRPFSKVSKQRFVSTKFPVIFIDPSLAENIVEKTLNEAIKEKTGFYINGSFKVSFSFNEQKAIARNIVGMIKVPNAKNTIVVGAHGDHLGAGLSLGSRLSSADSGVSLIHYGADDNASGVASVMELAHYFSDLYIKGKINLKKNIIFAIWSGEEKGLLGSNSFIKNHPNNNFSSYINMDMVGRLEEKLYIQGIGSSDYWKAVLPDVVDDRSFKVVFEDDPYLPTDTSSFYYAQIPILGFFTGSHADYHTPRDRPELINFEGLENITSLISRVITYLATDTRVPEYKKVERDGRGISRFSVYLGTLPDYSYKKGDGLFLSGIVDSSPADKAKLQRGDLIIELAGFKINDIYDYMDALNSIKPNKKYQLKVIRDNKIIKLGIIPTAR